MIKKSIIDNKNNLIVLAIYTFILLFFCSMMSPLYPTNDWSDINLYFNLGKAMFNGHTLYTEAFDHKGPFIFILYGIGYLISNTSFLGMYFIEGIAWTFMVFAAYLTARLYVDKIYAFAVALIFPVLMLSHNVQGGSAEEFIAIAAVISLYLFILFFKEQTPTHKPAYMIIHGLMVAVALFTKFNLILFWFFPLLAVFVCLLRNKEYKNLLCNIGAFIIGFLIIALPICLYLFVNNALSEAWDIYITLNRRYANVGGPAEVLELLVVRIYQRLRFDKFEFLIILIGAIYFPIAYLKNKLGRVSIILSFLMVYTAIFMAYDYRYYYSIPYYIYCMPGLIVLCQFFKLSSGWRVYTVLTTLALAWGITFVNFFGMNISDLIRRTRQESITNSISDIISKEKNPTLLNLGLDENNNLFTTLNIVPSVRYFISPNLTYKIYPQMRDTQTSYIRNKEVQFVILPEYRSDFDYFFNLPALHEYYTLQATFLDKTSKCTFYLYKRND